MTKVQKLTLEQSELRQKLNDLLAVDSGKLTDDQRNEMDTLSKRAQELEPELRAAVTAEGLEQAQVAGEFNNGDGEAAEVRALLGRATVNDYLAPAANSTGLSGAAKELNEALEVPLSGQSGICIPWQVLEVRQAVPLVNGEAEKRAFTDTGDYAGGVAQRPILQRLFGPGIMDLLGVRIDSVPAGRTEWPLITNGVAPVMKAEGGAADAAVSATFGTETLKPKRLTGRYEYTHEMAAQVPDLEQALRRDLVDAVKSKMNDLILNGDEGTNAQEPDGFFTTMTAPSNPGSVSGYRNYSAAAALGVDGIHASMESEVAVLLGTKTYQHAASVYTSNDGVDGMTSLTRRCLKCMASSYIAAPSSNVQQALLHAAGPNGGSMRGDSIAAVWPTLEVVRDIYSKASQGVVLTWVTLWDAQTAFRSAAYVRTSFKLA